MTVPGRRAGPAARASEATRAATRGVRSTVLAGAVAVAALGLAACGGPQPFSPEGEIPTAPSAFLWPDTDAADGYVLQVFAPDGSVLFESERVEEPWFPVDEELRGRLEAAGRFEWRVRAYDGDRIHGHSDLHSVEIGAVMPRG